MQAVDLAAVADVDQLLHKELGRLGLAGACDEKGRGKVRATPIGMGRRLSGGGATDLTLR